MTENTFILIGLVQIIQYWIRFVEFYIAQSHYQNRWRPFANGLFTNFSEIWMKMENFLF